eukprot:m.42462 g.42462  ORF g.42462 m.42462 type:complete len:566 (+) comp19110_c0_seq1:135-1832(+)
MVSAVTVLLALATTTVAVVHVVSAAHPGVANSELEAESKPLPFAAFTNLQLWPQQEFTSFFHSLYPQPDLQKQVYTPTSKFGMFAERDLGGWNNIRMGYEMAVCLAFKHKRPIALPTAARFYLVESKAVSIFDYFDQEHFSKAMPTIANYVPGDKDVYNVEQKFSLGDNNGGKQKPFSELPKDKHWYFGESRQGGVRIFGQYTEFPDFQPSNDYIKLMHQVFRVKAEILDKTIDLLVKHDLLPYQYNAMHVRRNDFQYHEVRHASHQKIFDHVKDFVKGEVLLIISDEYDLELKTLMETVASRVVYWHPIRAPDGLLIDMLAAVPSKRFFGSPLSTFSAGIVQFRNRLRPDVRIQYTMPYTRVMSQLPSWARAGEITLPAPLAPVFKDIGYETFRVNSEIKHLLMDLYDDTNVGLTFQSPAGVIGDSMIKKISREWKYKIDLLVRPLLEQWVGFKLKIAPEPIAFRRFLSKSHSPTTSLEHSVAALFNVVDLSVSSFATEVSSRHTGSWELEFDTDYMLFFATGLGRPRGLEGKEFVDLPLYYDAVNPADCNGLCGGANVHVGEL